MPSANSFATSLRSLLQNPRLVGLLRNPKLVIPRAGSARGTRFFLEICALACLLAPWHSHSWLCATAKSSTFKAGGHHFETTTFSEGTLSASSFDAQAKHSTKSKAPAAAPRKYDCGQGVELRLSSPQSSQGSLLVVEVRSAKPPAEIKGAWNEKEIPFWQEDAPGQKGLDVRRALLGVDLEQAAGEYKLTVSDKIGDAEPATCSASVSVREGKFATERLAVAPNFVEPNPEQLARAEEERKRLREIFATVTPERLWHGPFRIPLDGVKTGGNFGRRRVLNGQPGSPHSGVDFPAPTGTPVHAAQRGRVVLAEPLYFSGNTVIVDHGLGVYTLYAHFSEIDAKPGDLVEAGALLGKVGATGRVTGPHLHWGLTVNRARVNALQLVALGKAVGVE
jgi:murein DD-endopeptidase MepM/ murein hydrolase activator NlpD